MSKNTYTLVRPEPPVEAVRLELEIPVGALAELRAALVGRGLLGGAWFTINDAFQKLAEEGLV